MLYDELDFALSHALGVSVEEYIEKIEKTTKKRAEVIIYGLFTEDEVILKKVKRIFNLIK